MSMTKLDANQVIKTVFDEASGTLKTSATAGTFEVSIDADSGDSIETRPMAVDNTVLLNAVTGGADVNSSAVDVINYKSYFISLSWASIGGGADGSISIQVSTDNSTWHTVASSTTSIDAAGDEGLEVDVASYRYFRLAYSHGTSTGGTITAKYMLKG